LDGERQLARVARHLAAPAPIAAGLLARDPALFAQRHRHPTLRQEQGRADTDDPAADDNDVGAGGPALLAWDRINAWRHALAPLWSCLRAPVARGKGRFVTRASPVGRGCGRGRR